MSTDQHQQRTSPFWRTRAAIAACAAGAWLLSAPAAGAATLALQASRSDQLRPPTPSADTSGPGLLALVAFALLIGMVVVAMLIPTKRGHQD